MSDSDHIMEDDDQLLSIENDASADINDVALQPEIITAESSSLPGNYYIISKCISNIK